MANEVLIVLKGVDNASKVFKKVGDNLGGIGKKNKGLISGFTNLGASIAKIGVVAGAAAVGGVALLGAGLASFAVSGIKKAADLDQKMADIAAVMGKTKDAVTPLKDEILKLAVNPKLTVNAGQAAEAVELLARNGLKMEEILGGAAESTIALANATGAEFGTAADIATDVMAIFGDETFRLADAIDGITGVTTNSKFTIDDYGLALASVGGIAGGMGVSLEDMNTVITATSSQFNSGRTAGTSFKTLLQRMAKPTDEMTAAMRRYGISLFDSDGNMKSMAQVTGEFNKVFQGTATVTEIVGGVTDKMLKAHDRALVKIPKLNNTIAEQKTKLDILNQELGTTIEKYGEGSTQAQNKRLAITKLSNSISENQTELSNQQAAIAKVNNANVETITSTKKLTEEEKAHLAALLGGADGARTILGLSKLTEEQFLEQSKAVNASGQAMKAAATKVDSVQGAMAVLSSVIEAIQIKIGDKFLPLIKRMTILFTEFVADNGPQLEAFFDSVATGIEGFIDKIMELFTVFQGGGLFGSRSGSFGSEGLLSALGLDAETIAIIETTIETILDIWERFKLFVSEAATIIAEHSEAIKGAFMGIGAVLVAAGIVGLVTLIVAALSTFATPLFAIIAVAALLGAAWAENWFGIRDIVMTVINTVTEIVMVFVGIFVEKVWPSLKEIFNNIVEAVNRLGIDWGQVWEGMKTALAIMGAIIGVIILTVMTIIAALVVGFIDAFVAISQHIDEFQAAFALIWEGIKEVIQGSIDFIYAIFTGDWAAAWEALKDIAQGAVDIFDGIVATIFEIVKTQFDLVGSFLEGFVTTVIEIFQGLFQVLVGGSIVPDMVNDIVDWFFSLPDKILGMLEGFASTVTDLFSSIFGGDDAAETADFSALDASSISEAFEAARPVVEAVNNLMLQIANSTIPEMLNKVGAFGKGAMNAFNQLSKTVQSFAMTTLQMVIDQITLLVTQAIPNMMSIWASAMSAMVSATLPLSNILESIVGVISGIATATNKMKVAFQGLNTIIPIIKKVVVELEKLADTVNDVADAFRRMAENAKAAADAAKKTGDTPAPTPPPIAPFRGLTPKNDSTTIPTNGMGLLPPGSRLPTPVQQAVSGANKTITQIFFPNVQTISGVEDAEGFIADFQTLMAMQSNVGG